MEGGGKRLGKLKVGPPCHWATDSDTMLSADEGNVHKPQDRLRQSLAAVWHPTNSD